MVFLEALSVIEAAAAPFYLVLSGSMSDFNLSVRALSEFLLERVDKWSSYFPSGTNSVFVCTDY